MVYKHRIVDDNCKPKRSPSPSFRAFCSCWQYLNRFCLIHTNNSCRTVMGFSNALQTTRLTSVSFGLYLSSK